MLLGFRDGFWISAVHTVTELYGGGGGAEADHVQVSVVVES
jgi:hypothetical protein